MPMNPETGKTVRRTMTESEVLEYRLNQKVSRAEVKRGKRRARNSPDMGEPEGSGISPLAGIGMLTLSSGGSSAAQTPSETPATLPQPPLPSRTPLAPTPASRIRIASKPSTSETPSRSPTEATADDAASTSQLFQPVHSSQQALAAPDYASLLAAVEKNTEKIRALEKRIIKWETWGEKVNSMMGEMGDYT